MLCRKLESRKQRKEEDEQTMREITLGERKKKQMSFTEKYQRRQNQEKLRNPGRLDCFFKYQIILYKLIKICIAMEKFLSFGNLILNTTLHILQLPLQNKGVIFWLSLSFGDFDPWEFFLS